MPSKLHIDFETRSAADLKKTGVHKYAEHWSTDIICLGWAFDEEEPNICTWKLPSRLIDHITAGGLVVAHNAAFELNIWNTVCTRKYNWPRLRPEQVDCTMSRAYAMNLPGSLDGASKAVGLTMEKDMAGHRLMLKMSQPKSECPCGRKPSCLDCEGQVYSWHQEPDQLKRLYDYCKQDLVVERELDKRILALPKAEKALWVVDQRINDRGIRVDVRSATIALDLVESEMKRLNEELRRVTGEQVATYNSHQQLKDWLKLKGVETPGVAKNDVAQLLSSPALPSDVRRALEIRQEAAKSSTRKLTPIINGATADERLKGLFQFNGAGQTGRWAGRRVQPHNLPRLLHFKQSEIDHFFDHALKQKDPAEYTEFFIGKPMDVVSEALRGFLMASPDHELLVVDFNAIEARVLGWLANQKSVIDVFLTGADIYKTAAAAIFDVPVEKVTKEQRQVGKVAILALGYGGGVGAFQTMAVGYGVTTAPALKSLWASATEENRQKAMSRWNSAGVESGINKQEWIASELIKLAWRDANQNIVGYWTNIELAACAAVVNPGRVTEVGGAFGQPVIRWVMKGSFLFCQLPSGRCLSYPFPKIKEVKTPWGVTRKALTYKYEYEGHWIRGGTYGGSIVENITQAVARDCLACGIMWCEANNYPVVLHVHDEIGVEVKKGTGDLAYLEQQICKLPPWANGLPLKAEGWRGVRYRK